MKNLLNFAIFTIVPLAILYSHEHLTYWHDVFIYIIGFLLTINATLLALFGKYVFQQNEGIYKDMNWNVVLFAGMIALAVYAYCGHWWLFSMKLIADSVVFMYVVVPTIPKNETE